MTTFSLHAEIKDEAFRWLVPEDALVEHLATGLGFVEGPVWHGDCLLFSDIPRNRIVRWRMLAEGPELTTFRRPSGNSNGLTLDLSGRLIACEHSTRRVTRTEIDGTITVLADRFQGRRLNSPNDVVVRSDGSIYFTDPPYGLARLSVWKEQPRNGVYHLAPNGELDLLADDFDRPNGLAFSPDENVLYVNDTERGHIRAFDVAPEGGIRDGRVHAELQGQEPGRPDGMKVDQQGNIYCTGPGGFWIVDPAGKHLGRVLPPELPANLAWGDADWGSLYMTARTGLYRIRLNVPGVPVH